MSALFESWRDGILSRPVLPWGRGRLSRAEGVQSRRPDVFSENPLTPGPHCGSNRRTSSGVSLYHHFGKGFMLNQGKFFGWVVFKPAQGRHFAGFFLPTIQTTVVLRLRVAQREGRRSFRPLGASRPSWDGRWAVLGSKRIDLARLMEFGGGRPAQATLDSPFWGSNPAKQPPVRGAFLPNRVIPPISSAHNCDKTDQFRPKN